ncbi:mycothiol transferase [Kocuria palustris]|uniref:mycothiol transferase n=1 Tax=Kocuria palustris TaxID=71999 RepID=UPI0035D85161
MPFFTRQVTTEHDALAAFASQQIRQVATTLQGLDAEQLRRTPAASQMSLGGIARHCLFVGNEGIFASLDPARARTHGTRDFQAGVPSADAVHDDDTAESLITALHDMAAWVEHTVPSVDLEARIPVPDKPWFPDDVESWPVRWVVLHAIEEYARHAGHADILREQIDDKGAYELNALADGEPWAPEDWEA